MIAFNMDAAEVRSNDEPEGSTGVASSLFFDFLDQFQCKSKAVRGCRPGIRVKYLCFWCVSKHAVQFTMGTKDGKATNSGRVEYRCRRVATVRWNQG
jgi:hypothetical protein